MIYQGHQILSFHAVSDDFNVDALILFGKFSLYAPGAIPFFACNKSLFDLNVTRITLDLSLVWLVAVFTSGVIPTSRYAEHLRHTPQLKSVLVLEHEFALFLLHCQH
ncbi:hypothetical protein [Photobacterium damselae]|uniref:hypothetical protein n=1 Tax=Photobacterium damselae TaxID=38293 RepID=UPI0010FD4BDB|nr:hypothetical protein [Photobacterium damselae]TLS80665.1 hypothetical protein FD721_00570 [Photobacterium damselae subsp. damselae]